jgi:hypothetical protein
MVKPPFSKSYTEMFERMLMAKVNIRIAHNTKFMFRQEEQRRVKKEEEISVAMSPEIVTVNKPRALVKCVDPVSCRLAHTE